MPRRRRAAAARAPATTTLRVDSDVVRRRGCGTNKTHTSKTVLKAEFEIYKRAAAAGIAPPVLHVEADEEARIGDAASTTTRFTTDNGGRTLKKLLEANTASAAYWSTSRARKSLIKAVMHQVWALHDLGICHGDLHGENVLVLWVHNFQVGDADRASKGPANAYDKSHRFFRVSLIDFGNAREGASDPELANDRIEALDMLNKLLPLGARGNNEALKLVHRPPTESFPWNIATTETPKKAAKKVDDARMCDACERSFSAADAGAGGGGVVDGEWWFCSACEGVRSGIETLRASITSAFKTLGSSRQVAQKGPWRGKAPCKYPRQRPLPRKTIAPRSIKTISSTTEPEHEHEHELETADRASTPLTPEECEFYATLWEFEEQPLADAADYCARLPCPVVEVTTSKKRAVPEEDSVSVAQAATEVSEPPKKRARARKAVVGRTCSLCEKEIPGGTFAIERNRDGFVLPVENVHHARTSSEVYHKRCFYPKETPVVVEDTDTETEEDEASLVYDDDPGFIHAHADSAVVCDYPAAIDDRDTDSNVMQGYPESPPPRMHHEVRTAVRPLFSDDEPRLVFGTVKAMSSTGKDLGTFTLRGAPQRGHIVGARETCDVYLPGAPARTQCVIKVACDCDATCNGTCDPRKARYSLHNAASTLGTSTRFFRDGRFEPMCYHDSELGFRPGATAIKSGDIFAFGPRHHFTTCQFKSGSE